MLSTNDANGAEVWASRFRGGGISPPNFGGLAELVSPFIAPALCPAPPLSLRKGERVGQGQKEGFAPPAPFFVAPPRARGSLGFRLSAPPPNRGVGRPTLCGARGALPHGFWGRNSRQFVELRAFLKLCASEDQPREPKRKRHPGWSLVERPTSLRGSAGEPDWLDRKPLVRIC